MYQIKVVQGGYQQASGLFQCMALSFLPYPYVSVNILPSLQKLACILSNPVAITTLVFTADPVCRRITHILMLVGQLPCQLTRQSFDVATFIRFHLH